MSIVWKACISDKFALLDLYMTWQKTSQSHYPLPSCISSVVQSKHDYTTVWYNLWSKTGFWRDLLPFYDLHISHWNLVQSRCIHFTQNRTNFAPCNFGTPTLANSFARLEIALAQFCLKRDNFKQWNSLSFN